MYEEFYGLKQRPFTKTPDPQLPLFKQEPRGGIARLQYAIEEKDLILLTGESRQRKDHADPCLDGLSRRKIPGHM